MSMTEELCALVAESQSAAASADSGSEEADAEVRVKSEICSDADTKLIEVECNAQLMSQPFVVLRDVLKRDVSSPVGEPVNAGLHEQLLLPLEAHLEDKPEVDDLFPQFHEDRVRKVKRVTQKRPVSVVSLAPSIVRSDASVDHPSLRKRCGKSETLPRPQASAQSAPASVCDDDLPLLVLHAKWAKQSSTSSSGRVLAWKNVSVVSDKGAEGSKQGMKRKTSMRDTCEDDIPLSVLRDKWASEMAGEKRSASVKRSRSVKRKVTVTRGKCVTQSVKRTVTVTPEKRVTWSVKRKVSVTPEKCVTHVASRILQSTLRRRSRVKSCCHCDVYVHGQQALNKHMREVHNFHPCGYAYCDSYWASAGAAAQH